MIHTDQNPNLVMIHTYIVFECVYVYFVSRYQIDQSFYPFSVTSINFYATGRYKFLKNSFSCDDVMIPHEIQSIRKMMKIYAFDLQLYLLIPDV